MRDIRLATIVQCSELERKITNIMEAVHSLAGNCCDREIAYIAYVLRDLTREDLAKLKSLDTESIPTSYEEVYPETDELDFDELS